MTAGARPVRLKRPVLGIVCAKCVRRFGGGKAGKQLTRALRGRVGGKVQAAEVGCLKLCPKHRVVVVPTGGPAAGQAHVVDAEGWAEAAAALFAPGPLPPAD